MCTLYQITFHSMSHKLMSCGVRSTNPLQLNELKRRWLEAGQPEIPDWRALLQDL